MLQPAPIVFPSFHHEFLTSSALIFDGPQGLGSPARPFSSPKQQQHGGNAIPNVNAATASATASPHLHHTLSSAASSAPNSADNSPSLIATGTPLSGALVPAFDDDDFDELDGELDNFRLEEAVGGDLFPAGIGAAASAASATQKSGPTGAVVRTLSGYASEPRAPGRDRFLSEDLAAAFADFVEDAKANHSAAAGAMATTGRPHPDQLGQRQLRQPPQQQHQHAARPRVRDDATSPLQSPRDMLNTATRGAHDGATMPTSAPAVASSCPHPGRGPAPVAAAHAVPCSRASFDATCSRLHRLDFSQFLPLATPGAAASPGDRSPGLLTPTIPGGPTAATAAAKPFDLGALLSGDFDSPLFQDPPALPAAADASSLAAEDAHQRKRGRGSGAENVAPGAASAAATATTSGPLLSFDLSTGFLPRHAQHLPISQLLAAQQQLQRALAQVQAATTAASASGSACAVRTAPAAAAPPPGTKPEPTAGSGRKPPQKKNKPATRKANNSSTTAAAKGAGGGGGGGPSKRKRKNDSGGGGAGGAPTQRRVTKWQRELRGVLRACLWELRFYDGAITELSRRYNIPIRTLRRYKHASLNPAANPTANDNAAITFPAPLPGEAVPRPPREVCQFLAGFSWHAYEGELVATAAAAGGGKVKTELKTEQ